MKMTLLKYYPCFANDQFLIILSPSTSTNASTKTCPVLSVDLFSIILSIYDARIDSVRNASKNILGFLIKSLALIAVGGCPQREI